MARKNNVNFRVEDKTLDNIDKLCDSFHMARSDVVELLTAFFFTVTAIIKEHGKRGVYNARND